MELLPLGIPNWQVNENHISGKKVIFVTIGVIAKIKGQDIIINAVNKIPSNIMTNMEIWFVGSKYNQGYFDECMKLSKHLSNIKWFGAKDHEETLKILERADVLISASREDMLPIVVSEALMCQKTCIVSDAIGTAFYMHDNVDGIIFESENVNELSEKITWCIEHREKLDYIGKNGRMLYEKEFSLKVFEDRLLKLIES
jgi:glycosyltransferase involved in cell wall biosynthesis